MTRATKIIIGLAIFVAIIPLLGFPGVVKDGLTVIMGLAIAAITYWAEKHAKFCPECKVPEGPHHDHTERSLPTDEATRTSMPPAVSPVAVVGADVVSRPIDGASVRSTLMRVGGAPSPSPFSFDAEKKPNKVRKSASRKEVVAK